ncbi:MAG TPA: PTS beta-glucoside transporter subunit EIIBCA [Lactobacillus sp.]|nr:PTS beta-glucoside transporter subunit EIIBCA [Lactobacillus sp.]
MAKSDDTHDIIQAVGGKENINNAWHCMTRLRFNIKDKDKIDYDALKKVDPVMGTNYTGNQLQVVIGTNVADYYAPLAEQLGIQTDESTNAAVTAADGPQEKQNFISKLMDIVSGVFGPIVPAIAGAGMIKGLMAGMAALKWISNTTPTYQVIDMLASGVFTFLPFFVAVSAARIFKVNEFLALPIAAAMQFPTLTAAPAAGQISSSMLFGPIPVPVFNYAGTVIPIILSIWLLSYIWRFVDKHLPDAMRTVFTPTISLFIGGIIALTVVGPLGIYGGNWLADGVRWLFSVSSIFAGIVVGAIRPIAVMTGLHHAMTPIALQNFANQGYDQFMPKLFMANMAISGATLAVYFKTSSKKEKSIVVSSAISAFLGITEPALFGVLTKYKKAFIAATIGSSVASAFISFFGVRIYAFILSSIFSLPAYVGKYFVPAVLGIIIAIGVSFAITWFLVPKEVPADQDFKLNAVTTGQYVPLAQLNDGVFSKKMVGDGYAMQSDDGVVFAPVTGRISTIFPTKHAIGITTADGIEVLVHMGLDTVDLAGKPFEVLVKVGDQVTPHTQIAQMDLKAIAAAGKDSTIVVVVTNMDKIKALQQQFTSTHALHGGQPVATIELH